jgi:P-type Ca2+ transporter type 2C
MRKASRVPTTINLGGYRSEAGMTMAVSQQVRGSENARSGWHASEATAVARELEVEPEHGLTVEEARSRLQSHGPNRLTGAKKESGLQAFVRQYRGFMQIILLAAAVINLVVTGISGPRSSWPA